MSTTAAAKRDWIFEVRTADHKVLGAVRVPCEHPATMEELMREFPQCQALADKHRGEGTYLARYLSE